MIQRFAHPSSAQRIRGVRGSDLRSAAVIVLVIWATWALPISAHADRIRTVTGEIITGEILTSDTERVFIRAEGGELGIVRSRIAEIERESRPVTLIQKGYLDLVTGRASLGFREWDKALRQGSAEAARALNDILIDRNEVFRQAVGSLPASEKARAVEALSSLARNAALTPEARFVCVEALTQLDADDRVAEILSGPEANDLPRSAVARAFLVRFWRGHIRRQLAVHDYSASLAAIEQLQLVDEGESRPQRALWLLSRIGEARDQGETLEALRIAVEDLLPILPEVANNRIAQLLQDLPGWATNPDAPPERFPRAREFVETTFAGVMPIAASATLEDLLAEKAGLLLLEGQTTDTLDLLRSAPQLEGRERIRDLALRAEYRNRLAALPKSDPLALYRLGEWAAKQERADWALAIFTECLDNPAVRPLAQTQIRILRDRIESRALESSMSLYKHGRMFDALEALDPILKRESGEESSTFRDEARKMASLIRTELRIESEKRPYQAEVLYQQAERAFFAGDHAAAIRHLADVLRQYGDTPASQRADTLLPQVVRTLEIERIEGRNKPIPEIPPEIRARAASADTSRLDQEIRSLLDALEPPTLRPRPDFSRPK